MSVCVLVYFKDYYDIDSNQFLFLREASYPLKLGVSMFDPTREHDTNPTRVFPG